MSKSGNFREKVFVSSLCHYANLSVQYTAIFHGYKNDYFQSKNCNTFLIFAQNIDCEAVLTSTHNQCFGVKIRKIIYPCKPQFYYIRVGCKGVFVTRNCFLDALEVFPKSENHKTSRMSIEQRGI